MSTIFALSTPPGKSGVAVIRISGDAARDALAVLGAPLPAPRVATLAALRMVRPAGEQGAIIDKALIIYFPAPHSFTGEDVIELHVHGSRAVIRQLLDLLGSQPFLRPARPGEFTRRAFANGKMDLTAAEGLADLIDAETEAQRKQALRMMQGEAAGFYSALRAGVLHALAYLEAYIDFPDEDIPSHVLSDINKEIQYIISSIESQLGNNHAGERIRDGVRVVIIGPPNVGKSSLMNLLARRDVAIVCELAGTTRDVIEVHLDLKGYCVILSDTAGIREDAGVIEREGIKRSFDRAREADITLVMFDPDTPLSAGILPIIDDRAVVVMNKSDLLLPSAPPQVAGRVPIPISVKTHTGIDALLGELELRLVDAKPAESSFITRARHRSHLERALVHLRRYGAQTGSGIELHCEELRRSATEIGEITGQIVVDEVLGHIFSSFCIGK